MFGCHGAWLRVRPVWGSDPLRRTVPLYLGHGRGWGSRRQSANHAPPLLKQLEHDDLPGARELDEGDDGKCGGEGLDHHAR